MNAFRLIGLVVLATIVLGFAYVSWIVYSRTVTVRLQLTTAVDVYGERQNISTVLELVEYPTFNVLEMSWVQVLDVRGEAAAAKLVDDRIVALNFTVPSAGSPRPDERGLVRTQFIAISLGDKLRRAVRRQKPDFQSRPYRYLSGSDHLTSPFTIDENYSISIITKPPDLFSGRVYASKDLERTPVDGVSFVSIAAQVVDHDWTCGRLKQLLDISTLEQRTRSPVATTSPNAFDLYFNWLRTTQCR